MERITCIDISAPAPRIWRALTDTVESASWYYGTGIVSSFEPGAPYRYTFPNGETAIEGTIHLADAPRLLDMTFRAMWSEDVAADTPSRVIWSITALDTGCRVCVAHDGLVTDSATDLEVVPGWPELLRRLKDHLER